MKKGIILVLISLSIVMVGCTKNNEIVHTKTVSSNETSTEKVDTKTVTNNEISTETVDTKTVSNNETLTETSNKENEEKKSYKEEYLKKLDSLDEYLKTSVNEGITTIEMKEAENTRYKSWDDMLNDIYNLLKTQLTEDEMKKLQEEEIEWIKYRDETAENEAKKFEGGTLQPIAYISSLTETTKNRCYELVNNYMR
ncbi:MAG: lysozyme inhibitor LprI family protein [Clostridium sp.]